MVDVGGDDGKVLCFTFGAYCAFVELVEDCLVSHRNHDGLVEVNGGSDLFLTLILRIGLADSGLCWKKLVAFINYIPGDVQRLEAGVILRVYLRMQCLLRRSFVHRRLNSARHLSALICFDNRVLLLPLLILQHLANLKLIIIEHIWRILFIPSNIQPDHLKLICFALLPLLVKSISMILLHVTLDLVQITLQLLQCAIIYIGHLLKIFDSIFRLMVMQIVLLGTVLATLGSV